jgi:hypothetical protein
MLKASRTAAVFILTTLLAAEPVLAAPSEVLGEGTATCGDFLSQPTMQSVRLEWVLGYISGRNAEAPLPVEKMIGRNLHDAQTPFVWLQNYCQANGAKPLIVAADELRVFLRQHE